MYITKLTFKNFMGYKQLSLPKGIEEFPKGLILVSGKNSYGKSSIFEGIVFAFFGPKIFKGRNAASFITYGESKAELTIFFTLDKKKYNIFRRWGRTGATTTKLFEWDKTTYREIKNFNIEKFFEISSEQALSTVFVRQGEVEELANKKGADLREMIIDLFRLDLIDDALNFLDVESKKKKFSKENLERNKVPIERIEEDINRITLENENFEKVVIEKKKKEEEYGQKIKNYPSNELITNLEKLYSQKNGVNDKFLSYKKDFEEKIKSTKLNIEDFKQLKKIVDKIEDTLKEKKKLTLEKELIEKRREATIRGLGKTKGKIEDNKRKIKKMKDSLKFTTREGGIESARCPTCQNELTKEHFDEMILEFNTNLKINDEKVKSITKIIDNFDVEINSYQNKSEKINESIVKIQGLKDDFENYRKYESELKKAQEELDGFLTKYQSKFVDTKPEKIKLLSIEKEKLYIELKTITMEIKEKQENIKINVNRIIDLRNEIKHMKKLEKEIGEFEIDIDHISKAKEFVRRFVTEYMVVKRLVKNIASTTNKYIKDFTSGQYSDLTIDLFGTKKTGLSLKIMDNFNGVHESIEVLSGGDKTALGMALRLAISELMSKIRPTKESPKKNPKIDFLLLDEPLAALDETRRERILKHLIKSKTFSQIFLITHTAIPSDLNTHKIIVNKDHSTGMSTARFEGETSQILY